MANGGTLLAATSVTTPAAAVASTSTPDAANVDGAVPKEHCRAAPVQTWLGISHLPLRDSRRVRRDDRVEPVPAVERRRIRALRQLRDPDEDVSRDRDGESVAERLGTEHEAVVRPHVLHLVRDHVPRERAFHE
jgi:hypothetical protein